MSPKAPPSEMIVFRPDGALLLPAALMAEVVMETAGCRVWINRKTGCLGLRLLRLVEDPPLAIGRVREGGRTLGLVAAGPAMEVAGLALPEAERSCEYRYFPKHHLIEIQVAEPEEPVKLKKKGFFDDYPGLEG